MRVARVYIGRTEEDGIRVLVDRLWPREMTKARADLDDWCRQVSADDRASQVVRPRPRAVR